MTSTSESWDSRTLSEDELKELILKASTDFERYTARVISRQRKQISALVSALKAVPIVRIGEPGETDWLTCIGCGAMGSFDCESDCWVLKVEAAIAKAEGRPS